MDGKGKGILTYTVEKEKNDITYLLPT